MALDDIDVSPDPEVQDRVVRHCEKCDAAMKQLGELPALSMHAAVRVFRCYACDHVVADRA